MFSAISDLQTTHTATNVRVTDFTGTHARATALVEAQHLPAGDASRHLLLKNIYHLDLARVYAARGDETRARAQYGATIQGTPTEYNDRHFQAEAAAEITKMK